MKAAVVGLSPRLGPPLHAPFAPLQPLPPRWAAPPLRAGDLAAIDGKYDAAVSTAVGALDYVVVESTSDAQRCVEHLRRSGAGVATFLILEKQKHLERAAAERVDAPEGEAPKGVRCRAKVRGSGGDANKDAPLRPRDARLGHTPSV